MSRKKVSRPGNGDGPQRIVVERDMAGPNIAELEQQFKAAVAEARGPLILDLTAATIIDSRGIALCVGLFKECKNRNLPFSIEAGPTLLRFFRMLKLDRHMQCSEKGGAP
jgi:anti-anti-sigma regulatory factor